ncbi:hypothetical protein ACFL35_12005 [Candidatus Riflebacteria bacterium]
MNKTEDPFYHRGILNFAWLLQTCCLFIAYLQVDIMWVYIGVGIMALARAGSQLNWYLGPQYFSGIHNAENYATASLFINGIRGIIGPGLGLLLLNIGGYPFVFFVMTILMILSTLLMFFYSAKFQMGVKIIPSSQSI